MTTVRHKLELLESIESLTAFQRARVLAYIRGLRPVNHDEDAHEIMKRQALLEIRQALRNQDAIGVQS